MIAKEDILRANESYDTKSYPEEIYLDSLEILRKTETCDKETKNAVEHLFWWKLSKVKPKKTPSSRLIDYRDSKGRLHYIAKGTGANSKAVGKAKSEEMINKSIKFRNKLTSYDKFIKEAASISGSSIVLPVFLVHIWNPAEYPVLDVNVWKVFLKQRNIPIYKHTKPRTWQNYEKYTHFFNVLVETTGLPRRAVDKGIWSIGAKL